MIRKNEFKQLDFQVKNAIETAIKKAKENSNNNDFLLFLSCAQYVDYLKDSGTIPYVVDYRPDSRHDSFRLEFLMEYLNANYSFKSENTVDSYLTVTFELMIYTHMWESQPFLKQFYRFAQLTNGLDYSWDVKVPDFPKYPFISDIRKLFETQNLEISELISSSFNSSLRNAFAHSEYNFGLGSPTIFLTNYKGKAEHELKEISFDDWTIRFCKSFLIAFHFQNMINSERKKLEDIKEYEVLLKDKNGDSKKGILIYDKNRDAFKAKMNE